MIENCLDGKSGAELNMFAAGSTVVCALSVESTDVGGCTCADGIGKELGAAGGGTQRGVELLEIDEQVIDDSEWGRGLEIGSVQLGLQCGGGMLGLSQQGDAFAPPGPQQEHGMRVSAALSFHASLTSASEPPPSTPFPPGRGRGSADAGPGGVGGAAGDVEPGMEMRLLGAGLDLCWPVCPPTIGPMGLHGPGRTLVALSAGTER